MYAQLYQKFLGSAQENFQGGTSSGGAVITAFLAVLLVVAIQLFAVQWLWNNVLVRVVSIARPIPTVWYTLGLLVLIAMIHPGYVATSV
jgi:hypothetical protein